jgi:hypothetical protein
MADTGAKYPTSATTQSVNPEDDVDWTNPTNIEADDAAYATTVLIFQYSYRLKAQGFDFSAVPDGSTIDGIKVEIERYTSYADMIKDYRVQLLDASGNLVGSNKAGASTWGTSLTVITYGGAADTWAASPTAAMVKDADFGVAFSIYDYLGFFNKTCYVDYIRITVYYTAGGVTEELSATLSGAGSLSGALSRKRGLTGALSGAGSLGGSMVRTRALSGVLSGAGSLSAALSLSGAVSAAVGGSCRENNELAERDKARIVDGIPESYLVAFYPALHGRGGTLTDRSQQANHGTISGATWKPSSRGLWVLDFDGDNDDVSLGSPTSLRITGAKTLEAWAYVHSVGAGLYAIVAWVGAGWATFRYMLVCDASGGGSGRWIAHFSDGVSDWNQSVKNNSVVLNTWQHIVGTYDGVSEGVLYINGVAVTSTSYAITTPTSTNNIKLGTCDNVSFFDGRIGMVRIYSRVLSDTEILRHYTRERHLFGV